MTLVLNLPPEAEKGLQEKAAQNGLAPHDYVAGLILHDLPQKSISQHKTVHLSSDETGLLARINQGTASEVWKKYDALIQKRDARALTSEEHVELLALSDRIEEENATRIGHVAELARLRGTTIPALLHTLGIGPHSKRRKRQSNF